MSIESPRRRPTSWILALAGCLTGLAAIASSAEDPAPAVQKPAASPAAEDAVPLPPRHLIPGVPYVNFEAVRKVRFDPSPKAFANPSAAAAVGMVLGYYGEELKRLERGSDAMPRVDGAWGRAEFHHGGTFEDLQKWIARDAPVVVSMSLVPNGHPLAYTGQFLVHFTGLERPRAIRTSGTLGDMLAPDAYKYVAKNYAVPLDLEDGRFFWGRVVVGYDTTRNTVLLHDPAFGPAWEVSREDFETMWSLSDNSWILLRPVKDPPPRTEPAAPYPERTVDQRAAEIYTRAYAASSQGQDDPTLKLCNEGLALPGLPAPWRHLFLLERGCRLALVGRPDDAVDDLERSRDIMPEHFRAWMYLSESLRFLPDAPTAERSEEIALSKARANAICRDTKSDKGLALALPDNLPFFGCKKPL